MSLWSLAQSDLADIMHCSDSGVRTVTVTDPSGESVPFFGWANDIYLSIDPGTGVTVSGRQASVSLFIQDLRSAGFGGIKGVPEATLRPWTLTVEGFDGVFKVVNSSPDAGAGLTVLHLEEYKK